MDAEESHRMAVKALAMSSWLRPSDVGKDGEELKTEAGLHPLNHFEEYID